MAATVDLVRTGVGLFMDAGDAEADAALDLDCATVEAGLAAAVASLRTDLGDDAEGLKISLLEQALRVAKLSVPRAASVLRNMLQFRRAYDWPLPLTATDVAACIRTGMYELLPCDRHGCPIVLFRAVRIRPTKACPIASYQRLGMYLVECAMGSVDAQHSGVTLLVDLRAVDRSLAGDFASGLLDGWLRMWRDAYPAKLRQLLVVHAHGRCVRSAAWLGMRLLKPKLRKRVHLLESVAELQQHADASALPADLGGALPAGRWEDWCAAQERQEAALRAPPQTSAVEHVDATPIRRKQEANV